MSEFKRTTSGLNNQHLFYDVDLIVFLEGGKTAYNKDEVYSGKFSAETEDIIFWKNVFDKFSGNKKIKFKSVGSKTTIKEIALDIIDGKLTKVLVAMDNEFDELLQKRFDHPNIYYTYGYSWENDVWSHIIIHAVIEELTAVEINDDELNRLFQKFLKNIKLAVHADAYLFKKESSFFPRKQGHMFCVDCDPVDLPLIKTREIDARIISKGITKLKATRYGNKWAIDPLKHCYGHFLSDFCCQVVIHYVKKRHSLPNISKDIINRMALRQYFRFAFEKSEPFHFYQNQFSKMAIDVREKTN